MKESMWGVFIIAIGAVGIVTLNLFQNITTTNDQTYYLMKETTEAAMGDSIDISYYRTTGRLRIVEEKFVENVTRRFAQSVALNRNYNIIIHDVVEEPPKVSLSIATSVSGINAMGTHSEYNILHSIDSIYEAIYKKEDFYDSKYWGVGVPVPGIPGTNPDNPYKDGECPNANSEVDECISKDLQFLGWGDIAKFNDQLCPQDLPLLRPVNRDANYKECICGKWAAPVSETISSGNPVIAGGKATYTWTFIKDGPVNDINTNVKSEVVSGKCVTDLGINDLSIECPPEGITIAVGQEKTLNPVYTPKDAINRKLKWSSDYNNISFTPQNKSIYYPEVDYVVVRGLDAGVATLKAESTNKITATCKINVVDPDDIVCPASTTEVVSGSIAYAKIADGIKIAGMTYSISNSNIATIDNNGVITAKPDLAAEANISYTITTSVKTITCPLRVIPKDDDLVIGTQPVGSSSCRVGNIALVRTIKASPSISKCYYRISQTEFLNLALANTKLIVRKCGVNTPFVSCNGGVWDATEEIDLSSAPTTNYSISKSVVSYNETTNRYVVSYTLNITNAGWQPRLITENCRPSAVVQSYSGTVSGTLTDEPCGNIAPGDVRSSISISNCPGQIFSGNTVSMGANINVIPEKASDDTYEWSIGGDGKDSFQIVGSSSGPTFSLKGLTRVNNGSATVTLIVRNPKLNKDGDQLKDTCNIYMPYDPCSSFLVITPKPVCLVNEQQTTLTMGVADSSLFGNSNWTVTGALNYSGNTSDNAITITGNNTSTINKSGTVSYITQYNCNGVQKKDSVTIANIYPSGGYYCDKTWNWTRLAVDKCLPTADSSGYSPSCNPTTQYKHSNGKCYNITSLPAATQVLGTCPSGTTATCYDDPDACGDVRCVSNTGVAKSISCPDGWSYHPSTGVCYRSLDSSCTTNYGWYADSQSGKSCEKINSSTICSNNSQDFPCYKCKDSTTCTECKSTSGTKQWVYGLNYKCLTSERVYGSCPSADYYSKDNICYAMSKKPADTLKCNTGTLVETNRCFDINKAVAVEPTYCANNVYYEPSKLCFRYIAAKPVACK